MTVDKKILGGYALVLVLLAVVLVISMYTLREVREGYDGFLERDIPSVTMALELKLEVRDEVAQLRGILLFPSERARLVNDLHQSRLQLSTKLQEIKSVTSSTEAALLGFIESLQARYGRVQDDIIQLIDQKRDREALAMTSNEALPVALELQAKCDEFIAHQRRLIAERRASLDNFSQTSFWITVAVAVVAFLVAGTAGFTLTRQIRSQLREAIAQLGSSVSEILAMTTQVAAGAAETATAVNETTTTVEEVKQTAGVASQKAKYVSESAQRAAQTSQTGKKAVEQTLEGMNQIRQQMEMIAETVVRLSEQSQAIGEIIAVVND
ncbi:MAG TPA: MCP four helix bundle domain-containing protein, partial [Bacteroidota bacterium]|nr:MCP four helix bundle domain-containing protein [Bacteroidota bacterium]